MWQYRMQREDCEFGVKRVLMEHNLILKVLKVGRASISFFSISLSGIRTRAITSKMCTYIPMYSGISDERRDIFYICIFDFDLASVIVIKVVGYFSGVFSFFSI